MKFNLCCFFCLLCTFVYHVEGKDPVKGVETPPVSESYLQTQLMNEQISKLMANRISTNIEIAVEGLTTINEFIFEDDLLEYESLMFPADELYGFWETTKVNPYGNRLIAYPDTFSIDCSSFILPIDVNIKVTSNFGVRGRRMHNGIDLKVQTGDTIRSAFSGKIRIKGYERSGYGNYLVVRHSNGLETVYGHLSKSLVTENEIVKAGQPIGLGGNTGRSTGSHLHFETRFLGQALNPSHIIDFNKGGIPHNVHYVLYRENFDRNVNIYTSTSEQIVYHRVQQGETLSKIALRYRTTVAELCRLNGLTTKSILRVGQALRCGTTIAKTDNAASITASTSNSENTNIEKVDVSVENTENENYHFVKQGETLFSISKQYNISIDELCRLNGITEKSVLRIGQTIQYNSSKTVSSAVASKTTTTATNTAPDGDVHQPVYHQIKEGDTLGAIAQKYGISISQLCELNNITRTTILRIGRTIRCA